MTAQQTLRYKPICSDRRGIPKSAQNGAELSQQGLQKLKPSSAMWGCSAHPPHKCATDVRHTHCSLGSSIAVWLVPICVPSFLRPDEAHVIALRTQDDDSSSTLSCPALAFRCSMLPVGPRSRVFLHGSHICVPSFQSLCHVGAPPKKRNVHPMLAVMRIYYAAICCSARDGKGDASTLPTFGPPRGQRLCSHFGFHPL